MKRREVSFRLLQFGNGLLDYVFMPNCLGCEGAGEHWCETCEASIRPISGQVCSICQREVKEPEICGECRKEPPNYEALRAIGHYEGALAKAIIRLKYQPNASFAYQFAAKLAEVVSREDWEVDLVVPMPPSKGSLRERGYNQVEMLSKPLARLLGVDHSKKHLFRGLETRSQVGLNLEERIENLRDAFTAEGHLVMGKQFLLVDDVSTSGSSMNFAAKALKEAGAGKVFGICLAKADHNQHVV